MKPLEESTRISLVVYWIFCGNTARKQAEVIVDKKSVARNSLISVFKFN